MSLRILKSLSTEKYSRLLPRVFPGVAKLEIRDRQGQLFWGWSAALAAAAQDQAEMADDNPIAVWSAFGTGIEKRQLPDDHMQFRVALALKDHGPVGWLIADYNTQPCVSMTTAPEPLRRAFSDAKVLLQEELELQSECNQLAAELSERYEELNLVYSTKDQVEFFEEGQEALVRLVRNCADYLDVGLAALMCREHGLTLHNINGAESPPKVDELLDLLGTTIYDRVEAQVRSVVINQEDTEERLRLLAGRNDNVLAYPIVDNHGTVIGQVAVVARPDMHTFSNGDRNLLEVMAKKASRIIHTHHDSLTGLMNRSGFESSLIAALATTRSKNLQHCLLHIKLDQLRIVNDLMGHQEGDTLIRRVSKSLRKMLRDTDVMSHMGGGEFGVLIPNCDVRQGYTVAEKVRSAIHELSVVAAQRRLDVTACIGIAKIDCDTDGIVGVMASAEIACKAAREEGRDRTQIFEDDNTSLVRRSEEIEWIGRVQEAIRGDLFTLYCQPVLPLLDLSRPPHFEVLIRMRDDDGAILTPNVFLPAAERYQLMPLVDRWVVHHTLTSLGNCWDEIAAVDPVFCINLSGQSFANPGFQTFILDELREFRIPPENICFEVTETVAISNIDDAVVFMTALRKIGCRFSLDDFGAGLSSFGYLKVLPVDYLKIDGSFVREITTDEVSQSMVNAICQIGRTMQLSMVAEYVGDDETKEALRLIGVDYVQGFGIGRPVPISEILDGLKNGARAASA